MLDGAITSASLTYQSLQDLLDGVQSFPLSKVHIPNNNVHVAQQLPKIRISKVSIREYGSIVETSPSDSGIPNLLKY